jgi:hypothetical protein
MAGNEKKKVKKPCGECKRLKIGCKHFKEMREPPFLSWKEDGGESS